VNSQTKTTGYLVKAEGDEGEIKGVGIFAGNVYLLDAGKDEIWRYPGLSAGVGSRQRWLGAGVTPDLAEVVEMAIDGDIWLAFSSGKVERYRRGVKENFVISGLPDPIKGLNSIFTNEDCEKVYLFEKGQTRVVAIDKEGKYVKQYSWPGMGQVTDLAVSESLGKIYLLSGSSIYALDL